MRFKKKEELALRYSSEADWNKRKAKHLLHGATDLLEVISLEKRLVVKPVLSKAAKSGLYGFCA